MEWLCVILASCKAANHAEQPWGARNAQPNSQGQALYIYLVDLGELTTIVADLRAEGSDMAELEVKLAASGYPQKLPTTLSAFGNTPGGGVVIFGLDEANGFASVGVYDAAVCQAALAAQARSALDPPITFQSWRMVFEGAPVVVAAIDELSPSVKPCRVRASGKAYLRGYDGDYALSPVEEQAFLANRTTPTFDQQPVADASRADLDTDLVAAYLSSCRASSAALARLVDEDILFRTGVTVTDQRVPSVAGLLALGIYPQQFFPNLVIQASVAPGPGQPPGTRDVDPRRFDGPVPLMLDQALRWVQRNTRTRVRFGADGHGRDEAEYPPEAVRELVANALVHRDLGPYARAEPVPLRIESGQLVLSNPGGLWGLTVDRLGRSGVSSARNGWLLRICQNVRLPGDRRVVEALASGIPTVLNSLQSAGMVPPRFHDQGIRFTVRVPNHSLLAASDLAWLGRFPDRLLLNDIQRHALVGMRHGVRWSNKTFREVFPMDSREARTLLQDLVSKGLAQARGERGSRVYALAVNVGEKGFEVVDQPELPLVADRDLGKSDAVIVDLPGRGQTGDRSRNAEQILGLLSAGPATRSEIESATGLSTRQIGYALAELRATGQVALIGGPGVRDSRYQRASGFGRR